MSNWTFALNRFVVKEWRVDNPFSFLDEFDSWFAFECYMVGFNDEPPEGSLT